MGVLIQFETREIPDVLIVGKEIRTGRMAEMAGNRPVPAFWGRCSGDDTFPALEAQGGFIYEHSRVGVMIGWDDAYDNYTYVVGMLMKPGAEVPEGFVSYKLDATKVAVGWMRGKDAADANAMWYGQLRQALTQDGYSCNGFKWCMELFHHPRFTTPDENGNIITDYWMPAVPRDKAMESPEHVMRLAFDGEPRENALGFAAFLRDNGFEIQYNPDEYEENKWSGAIGGVVGDSIGYMHIRSGASFPDPWTIWFNVYEFDAGRSPEDEGLKEFVWENVNPCTRCHPGWENCGGGERVVFGRKFDRLCHSPMFFHAPDAGKLGKIKKLLLRIRAK